jgi:hypothetical protein
MASPRKPSEIKRNDTVVKVDCEVIDDARKVAALREMTLAEYLTEIVRPIARRDLQAEAQRFADTAKAKT